MPIWRARPPSSTSTRLPPPSSRLANRAPRSGILATYFALGTISIAGPARAQPPAPVPPPAWETQVGASFVGTSGNTETTTVGADFSQVRRWRVWQVESGAAAIRTTNHDVRTAERYLAAIRGKRQLTAILGLSAGERVYGDLRFCACAFCVLSFSRRERAANGMLPIWAGDPPGSEKP